MVDGKLKVNHYALPNDLVEEYLQRIDVFFKDKSQKDTYMVYIIIFGLAAALAYPFYDSSFGSSRCSSTLSSIYLKRSSMCSGFSLNDHISYLISVCRLI